MRLAVRSTVIASALAIATIAAPAASARYDLGLQQRLNEGIPAVAYAVPVSPPQAQTTGPRPEVRPNPDQQGTPRGTSVAPILHRVRASQLAATERAKEQALANHVPPNGRYSNADVNAAGHPIAAPAATLTASDSGFDWGDVAIGAGIILTIALLISAGGFAVRQRSQPRHS